MRNVTCSLCPIHSREPQDVHPASGFLTLATALQSAFATELTFKVPSSSKECFHEDIVANEQTTVKFVVVSGGHSDVTMTLKGPNDETIYQGFKKQFDMVTLIPNVTGTYTACFSNEFSLFFNKRVYMSFQVGEKSPQRPGEKYAAMHDVESSLEKMREKLDAIIDYQTQHRLQEAHGRRIALRLNQFVPFSSCVQTVEILTFFWTRSHAIKRLFY
ncbi:hypothetical protein HPB48_000491 [Haemaphysalis longicornis]|uniref:GOLD domain-containing protein n=1 Tax=Haemaphysalis longicornis TaxID=44386 RepID=A0A9J6FUR7_HAELO|nr:hypothetical protein HPB48_000491 [Haemaphysalis longicornis]